MKRRPEPRRVDAAMSSLVERLEPATPLGSLQRVWDAAVGPAVAAHARPTAMAGGVVTVTCESGVWAQELDLLALDLVDRLNAALGRGSVTALRCQATAARSWSRRPSR